ncbi:MAG: TSUP family transporter, partial [Candidatus Rokuibacteriota bacterium]
MPIPPDSLIVVALVIFAGYLIFGVTGFGASPITIPVLVHVLPLVFVLPLAALLDLGSALALGFHTRRQADTRELLTLVPFTLMGLTLGVTLLVRLPRHATLLALGLFVCGYALHVMLRRERTRRLTRWWAAPAGLVGGVVGALFGMGGPPYV